MDILGTIEDVAFRACCTSAIADGLVRLSGCEFLSEQVWNNVIFCHWPVPPGSLWGLLPAPLDLDLFDGTAWVSAVAVRLSEGRLLRLPPLPGLAELCEVNLRTYVRRGDDPGVWFFSIDASSRLAVWFARTFLHLPFFAAQGDLREQDGEFTCHFERLEGRGGGPGPARFSARLRPVGDAFHPVPGTIEYFLTERYSMYMPGAGRQLLRGVVLHDPWPLQRAEGTIEGHSLAAASGIGLPEAAPLLHFVRQVKSQAYPIKQV